MNRQRELSTAYSQRIAHLPLSLRFSLLWRLLWFLHRRIPALPRRILSKLWRFSPQPEACAYCPPKAFLLPLLFPQKRYFFPLRGREYLPEFGFRRVGFCYFKFSGLSPSNSFKTNLPFLRINTSSKYISPPPYCSVCIKTRSQWTALILPLLLSPQ